jgi:Mrp family chromosome partitioning ATPase
MSKKSKKEPIVDLRDVLSLSAADGVLQRTFDADVLQSFRYMSTDLKLNRNLPRRVAVIAALRGEGVTHTAVVLGATLAHDTGARVCVVELNWWSPGLISLLDPRMNVEVEPKKRGKKASAPPPGPPREPALPGHPGLSKVLSGEASLDDALIHTDMPNFDLLPAGDIPISRRPPMARSSGLSQILDQLSSTYDHLFLDIPAVRTTSDAIALAALADACIVVIQQGATSTAIVQQALDDVKSLTMLGVVLNKVSVATPKWLLSLVPQQ